MNTGVKILILAALTGIIMQVSAMEQRPPLTYNQRMEYLRRFDRLHAQREQDRQDQAAQPRAADQPVQSQGEKSKRAQ